MRYSSYEPVRPIVGFTEPVVLVGKDGKQKSLRARIDTGAVSSSINRITAEQLQLGPRISNTIVKNAHGHSKRPVVEATIEIAGQRITATFNVAHRLHLQYPILIGQNILKQGFVIDPLKDQTVLKKF